MKLRGKEKKGEWRRRTESRGWKMRRQAEKRRGKEKGVRRWRKKVRGKKEGRGK